MGAAKSSHCRLPFQRLFASFFYRYALACNRSRPYFKRMLSYMIAHTLSNLYDQNSQIPLSPNHIAQMVARSPQANIHLRLRQLIDTCFCGQSAKTTSILFDYFRILRSKWWRKLRISTHVAHLLRFEVVDGSLGSWRSSDLYSSSRASPAKIRSHVTPLCPWRTLLC